MRKSSTVMTLMMVAAATYVCQAQNNNPYRQAAPVLRPVAQEPRRRQQPQSPAPVSNPVPQPLRRPGPVPFPGQGTKVKAALDQEGKNLLKTFDDYLFSNLEQAYYRLSYAFKDAVKRTLDKCGCDAGTNNPLTDSLATPTS